MRRAFAWVAGAVGGLAAYRLVARRRGPAAPLPSAPVPDVDPRAEELRAKLDESRRPEAAEPRTPPAPAAAAPEAAGTAVVDPETRRRAVHEHGRAAVDEMRSGQEASGEPQ